MKQIFRVVKCGEAFSVRSEKAENGSLQKRNIILQEINGRYADSFTGALLGVNASLIFDEGALVFASLRFQAREYNGQAFQDVVVTDIARL